MDFKKIFAQHKNVDLGRIYTVSELWDKYLEYAPHINQNKVSTGIGYIDEMLGMVRPSQVLTIIAPTNVGKTAYGLQCAFKNAPTLRDKIIIIGECEIGEYELFERMIQYEYNLWTYEVEEIFARKTDLDKYAPIKEKYSNIITIIDRVKTQNIAPYIQTIEDIREKKCGLYILDYAGLAENQFKEEYARITYTMQHLKGIAQGLNIPIITFSQVPRADIKDKKEYGLYSGKGSGEVENSSQIVCTLEMFRGELEKKQKAEYDKVLLDHSDIAKFIEGEKPSHYLCKIKIEKKKQGNYGSTYLLFDKRSLQFTEIKEPF